jgi:UDP-glucose 4-epimerase
MKKILITGCSGYIGSHLCKRLSGKYIIHGLDKVDPIVPVHKFFKANINVPIHIEAEYDSVIHLAALVNVGESEQHPINYYITNLTGTMNIVNKIKTKNFVFASTGAAEYCYSPYGVSKRAAEDIVREYCTQHSPKDYSIFRFYNVIGTDGIQPTNPDGLFYKLIEATHSGEFTIYGKDYDTPDGTCLRDYVHVNEICQALETAIEQPSNSIECLGHGVGYSVSEIVNLFCRVNDVDFDIKYGPRRKGDLPISVLKNVSSYMKQLYTMEELVKV